MFAEIVMALISSAPDPDPSVRDAISASIYDVGMTCGGEKKNL